jgi:hypothetical protein
MKQIATTILIPGTAHKWSQESVTSHRLLATALYQANGIMPLHSGCRWLLRAFSAQYTLQFTVLKKILFHANSYHSNNQ